jgi:hypothetical protein
MELLVDPEQVRRFAALQLRRMGNLQLAMDQVRELAAMHDYGLDFYRQVERELYVYRAVEQDVANY